jgi:pyruvate/2-oxoglutarate dehydrogenase complex dihydrolipoamide acyltransferase (E2) component
VEEVPMKMPDLSAISSTVKVVRWLVGVGQAVRRGDHLLEVETDKSVMVVESTLTGTLTATRAEPGQEVSTGVTIATFAVERAAVPEEAALPGVAPEPGPAPPSPPTSRPPTTPGRPGGSFFARNRQAARPGTRGGPQEGGGEG